MRIHRAAAPSLLLALLLLVPAPGAAGSDPSAPTIVAGRSRIASVAGLSASVLPAAAPAGTLLHLYPPGRAGACTGIPARSESIPADAPEGGSSLPVRVGDVPVLAGAWGWRAVTIGADGEPQAWSPCVEQRLLVDVPAVVVVVRPLVAEDEGATIGLIVSSDDPACLDGLEVRVTEGASLLWSETLRPASASAGIVAAPRLEPGIHHPEIAILPARRDCVAGTAGSGPLAVTLPDDHLRGAGSVPGGRFAVRQPEPGSAVALSWEEPGAWRLDGLLAAGAVREIACPAAVAAGAPSDPGSVCRVVSGTARMVRWDGDGWGSQGRLVRFSLALYDGGAVTTCSSSCVSSDLPDWAGIDLPDRPGAGRGVERISDGSLDLAP